MADEPIAAVLGTTTPRATGDNRHCEYCDCKLTAKGEVLEMSQRARELRTLEDRLQREQQAHATTKGELVAAAQRVAELQAQLAAMAPAPVIDAPAGTWGMS